MGVVYKAQDTRLDRFVALKFLPHHLIPNESEQARFLQEAKAAAALNHPNVCGVIDILEDRGQQFIVMEYVEGVTLRQKAPIAKVDEAIGYAIQIGEALQAAHAKGIVHRDVKSENMMLTVDGRIKVMDFGLAKLKGSLHLTRESSTLGTLAYMAPEQIEGGLSDARSDIFSFGVVFFELLTGKLPFRGEHDAALMYSILNEEPESVLGSLPDVSPDIDRIVGRALEKDPADRYQHVDDMVSELRRLRKQSGRVVRPEATARHDMPAPRRKPLPWKSLMIGAGVVIVLGASAFLLLRDPFSRSGESASPQTILAVLPFASFGAPEKEYFADGLSEEIAGKLSGLSGLGVIAYQSTMQYKGTNKPLSQIAEELHAAYILRGTVRWQTDGSVTRVRVNPALIKATDGTQVWSQPYEADFSSAFKLQADIASTVARALNVKLAASEQQSLREALTENSQAYDLYLSALPYTVDIDNEQRQRIAIKLFQDAIELDTQFAAAYAQLSTMQSNLYWNYFDRTEENLLRSEANAQRALALEPQLPDAHIAMGDFLYHGRLDYEAALREYREAIRLDADNADAIAGISYVLRRQGKMEEAVEYALKALDLNPRNYTTVFTVGETYVLLRAYDKAMPFLEQATSLAPEAATPYDFLARVNLLRDGRADRARQVIEKVHAQKIGVGDRHFRYTLFLCDLAEGKYASAIAGVTGMKMLEDQYMLMPEELLVAQAAQLMKNDQLARKNYESVRQELLRQIKEHPGDPRRHSSLGIAYAGLGRKDDAIREGRRAVELMPVSREAWRGSFRLLNLAQIYTRVGELDLALDALDDLLSRPTDAISAPFLKIDPTWQPLRNHPRFQELIAKHS